MSKTFHLKYDFNGVERHLEFDTIEEFDSALTKAIEEPGVLNHNIDFFTTQAAPAPYPVDIRKTNGVRYKPTMAPIKR